MGTVANYTGGFILEIIRKASRLFDSTEGSLADNEKGIRLRNNINEFEPLIVSFNQAAEYIRHAKTIAIGERVCRTLHPGSVFTESIFLNELAESLVKVGHARFATIEQAEETLQKSAAHPIIISKVSGEYMEICASYPPECLYWRAEKRGLHCLNPKK